MICENEVSSANVSWHHVESRMDIQNSSHFSIYTTVFNNLSSVSQLIIHNITSKDAGGFSPKN